jgi:sugar/nucleoside kinase (ribokinase family)
MSEQGKYAIIGSSAGPDAGPGTGPLDAFFAGTVFLDVVLAGLPGPPVPGREIWAADRVLSPGGIANNAVGTARLGLRTGLAAAFGDDECGDLVWRVLSQEPNLDLAWSSRVPGLRTALTVSLADGTDRAMVSNGVLDPVPMRQLVTTAPAARATFLSLSTGAELPGWIRKQRAAGALVFADVGWDEQYGWSREVLAQLSSVDVFMPNEAEAMAYTGTSTVRDALYALGELVPLTVITRGRDGALALDAATGTQVAVEAIATRNRDPTGAGDSFVAGLITATLAGQPLPSRLRFACVCAGLSVRGLGGAAAAPTTADIAAWLAGAPPEYDLIHDLIHDLIQAPAGQTGTSGKAGAGE